MVAQSVFSGCYAVGLYNLVYDLAVFLRWDMNGIPVGEISSGKVLQNKTILPNWDWVIDSFVRSCSIGM